MLRRVALIALLALFSDFLSADNPAARLGELLAGMRVLGADFEQQLVDQDGNAVQDSSGSVILSHPGRFRWSTNPPFEQLVVSDGTTVWQYDPDLVQVVIRPLDKRADQVPSLLLSGDIDAVTRLYDIVATGSGESAERFLLRPRQSDALFTSLEIAFQDGRLEELVIADGFGQQTRVRFSNLYVPDSVDDTLFQFETPDGVDELFDE